VGIPGERLVRRGEQVSQILRDPIGLVGGKFFEVILAAEDRHRREVAIFIFDREVGDEAGSLTGSLDVASLQCRAHLLGGTVQGVAANDRVGRLVPPLGGSRSGLDAGRGEQRRRGGGPRAPQGVTPCEASGE
jgi:hypothetical protein